MEPGGFIDRYLLGRNLTPEEREHIRDGLDALANGGQLGGCGQKQGFNLFDLIVSSAYAYETNCYIIQKDGTRIELGIKTYEECRDAIFAYLNTLDFEDRVKVIQSAGYAQGSGQVPANAETITMTQWLWAGLDKLDDKPSGYYFNQWLIGNADGYNAGIAKAQEWRAIMADSTLSLEQMAQKLEAAGFDVGAAIAAASMGFAARGGLKRPLITESRANHILHGDGTGGGHLWPGASGKSPFPQNWTETRILDEINSIAGNSSIPGRVQGNGRIVKEAVVDGINIRVVIESPSKGGGVVTGFPTNVPRNTK